jgi:hypothetical protein
MLPGLRARDTAGRFTQLGIRAHLNTERTASMTQVIATESTIVHDPLLDIDRQLIAGQPVPPDLVDAYRAKVGPQTADQDPGQAARDELTGSSDNTGDRYDDLKVDELQARADDLGLEVTGTGTNGKVVRADLIAALRANDGQEG